MTSTFKFYPGPKNELIEELLSRVIEGRPSEAVKQFWAKHPRAQTVLAAFVGLARFRDYTPLLTDMADLTIQLIQTGNIHYIDPGVRILAFACLRDEPWVSHCLQEYNYENSILSREVNPDIIIAQVRACYTINKCNEASRILEKNKRHLRTEDYYLLRANICIGNGSNKEAVDLLLERGFPEPEALFSLIKAALADNDHQVIDLYQKDLKEIPRIYPYGHRLQARIAWRQHRYFRWLASAARLVLSDIKVFQAYCLFSDLLKPQIAQLAQAP